MQRLSFAGIEKKIHSQCDRFLDGVFEDREEMGLEDDNLIQDIIDICKKTGYGERALASGEWTWIQKNRQKEYKQLLIEGDKNLLVSLFRNFFRNQISYGISAPDIDSQKYSDDSKLELINDILLDIDTWREFCGDLPISELKTYNIGNPFGINVEGNLVMYNSCRHYYHAQRIKSLVETRTRPIIFEVGAGYGGVFYFLKQKMNNFCYIVCDLMETMFTLYYYTKKWASLLDKNIEIKWALDGEITYEDVANYDLILVPSSNHQNIKIGFDVAYNANSFSEMSANDVNKYFETIGRNRPEHIFHQNSNYQLWKTSSRGHTEVLAQDFPIPLEYKLVYQAISPWTGAGGRYREYLYTLR